MTLIVGLAPTAAASPAQPLFGITIDRVTHAERTAALLARLPRRPTTRVYFDTHEPAAYYAPALAAIHPHSAVMGELLDSSQEKAISLTAYDSRVRSYLAALAPNVDIWEVGNEVNGNWTGPYEEVAAKLTKAYEDVSTAAGTTALTLYANNFGPEHCGDGIAEATPVQFTQEHVPAAVREGLDYVLLSFYPTQCGGHEPNSAEVTLELEALHALYPNAKLGFGEVGLPRPATHRTSSEGEQIMHWAYSLNPGGAGGLPYYVGGYFWWYGAQDVLKPHTKLAGALGEAFEAEDNALT